MLIQEKLVKIRCKNMLAEKSDKAMDEDLAIAESYSFRRAFKEKR